MCIYVCMYVGWQLCLQVIWLQMRFLSQRKTKAKENICEQTNNNNINKNKAEKLQENHQVMGNFFNIACLLSAYKHNGLICIMIIESLKHKNFIYDVYSLYLEKKVYEGHSSTWPII